MRAVIFGDGQNEYLSDSFYGYNSLETMHNGREWWELHSIHDNRIDTVQSVTAVAFDPWEELIWSGMDNGRVVAYTTPVMERYAAFHAHETEVRQILVDQDGILCLCQHKIRCFSRGGLFTLDVNTSNQGLSCMSWLDAASGTLLVGGDTPVLGIMDVTTGGVIRDVPLACGIQTIKRSRAVWCGHTNGTISLLDPRTLKTEHTLEAHTGSIIDCDSKGDLLVTCGCSSRTGQLYIDPLVKVYDVRTMRSLPPIAFPTGPSMVKFHPKFYSTVVIVSQNGQFQLCDVQGDPSLSNIQYYQIDSGGDVLTAFDIASTGEGMVFGDAGGYVHLWADREDMRVNMYSVETEQPIPLNLIPNPHQNILDDVSLSLADMGMHSHMFGEETLLSAWPLSHTYIVGLAPHFIDPALLNQMRVLDFVGYIANPGYERYQMRGQHIGTGYLRPLPGKTPHATLGSTMLTAAVPVRPPKPYRWVEIKHSKLIFDDFDFGLYNKTTFAGLENSLPNSYCNSCLQALYFIKPLRISMLNHLCTKEFCLSCELGFLFQMIGQAGGAMGTSVQASNFLRAFRQVPQAAALGLFQAPELTDAQPLPSLIESFNRFILEQLHKETSTLPSPLSPPSSVIDTLFGTTTIAITRCLTCGHVHERTIRSFQFELVNTAPTPSSSPPSSSPLLSFEQAVAIALCRDMPTKAWCERCCHYQSSVQHKVPLALPHILCLSAPPSSVHTQPWRSSIPIHIRIKLDSASRQVLVDQETVGSDDSVYTLSAVISHISDPARKSPKGGHIVAEINVSKGQWYIFNDFCINPCTEQNVSHLDPSWKIACVLYYTRHTLASLPILPSVNPITKDVLFAKSPFLNRGGHMGEVQLLDKDEIPGPGDIVAVDAEFVSLGAEETEIRSDGTRVVINPAHFSLARVSVLRGDGPYASIPFIDDYIVTPEPITDYLTRFSGIEMGDLDPSVSNKPLTTLKAAYLKLRYLVDHGVRLVGHGLAKDFRIINIIVPPSQVIDTVELFNIKRQRKISLKFLASFLLGINIQTETHNSIEDACTALALSRLYNKLVAAGLFEQTIQQIYHVGRITNWNPEAVALLAPKTLYFEKTKTTHILI